MSRICRTTALDPKDRCTEERSGSDPEEASLRSTGILTSAFSAKVSPSSSQLGVSAICVPSRFHGRVRPDLPQSSARRSSGCYPRRPKVSWTYLPIHCSATHRPYPSRRPSCCAHLAPPQTSPMDSKLTNWISQSCKGIGRTWQRLSSLTVHALQSCNQESRFLCPRDGGIRQREERPPA